MAALITLSIIRPLFAGTPIDVRKLAETAQSMNGSVRTVMTLAEQSDILTERIQSLRVDEKTPLPS